MSRELFLATLTLFFQRTKCKPKAETGDYFSLETHGANPSGKASGRTNHKFGRHNFARS